jgi:phage terminase large subunit-like protein
VSTVTAETVGGGTSVDLDRVTRYARAVVDGDIVAGRAVTKACLRHLNDLDRQRTEGFPFYFDYFDAHQILDFFPTFLTLENGDPFTLVGWQEFCLGSIWGWKRVSDDYRRFETAYIETAKGSGKSPLLAGVGLFGLAFDGEQSAEIYSAAFDREQASIIVDHAIRMASDDPELNGDHGGALDIGKYNIAHEPSRSFFRAVSSEHRSKSGPRPSMVLIDELHEHRDGTVVTKMRAGFKSRKQPLLLEITNSGFDRTSICWHHHEKSISVLDGTMADEKWFAYVCHLDPCQACYDDGYRQPKDGCGTCDDWTDEAVWPKVNPSLIDANLPGYEYLRGQVSTALTLPSEQSMIRRLSFCVWTQSHQVWITSERWDACKRPSVSTENAARKACALGLDPSSTQDLTALVVAIRHDDPAGPIETVEIERLDEFGAMVRQAYTLNFHVELVPYFWLPKETLLARVRSEKIPYDVWERSGKLFVTPGPAIDHNAIYDFILKTVWPTFKPQKLGMDENGGRYLFMRLRDDGRLSDQVVSVGQGYKLSEAFKFMEILVAHRRLWHDGHPVLAWNMANAEPDRHPRTSALAIKKPSETKRIDGVIASAMAIHQLMTLPAMQKKPQLFFLGGRR